jgi:hypothetical protein
VALDQPAGEKLAPEIWLSKAVSYRMAPSLVFSTESLNLAYPVQALSGVPKDV